MRTAKQQLIHMVNQIAENNQYNGSDKAAQMTSTHLQKFWARSMKKDIKDYLKNNEEGLSATSKAAIALLK